MEAKIVEIFVQVDGFCKEFENNFKSLDLPTLSDGKKHATENQSSLIQK